MSNVKKPKLIFKLYPEQLNNIEKIQTDSNYRVYTLLVLHKLNIVCALLNQKLNKMPYLSKEKKISQKF